MIAVVSVMLIVLVMEPVSCLMFNVKEITQAIHSTDLMVMVRIYQFNSKEIQYIQVLMIHIIMLIQKEHSIHHHLKYGYVVILTLSRLLTDYNI